MISDWLIVALGDKQCPADRIGDDKGLITRVGLFSFIIVGKRGWAVAGDCSVLRHVGMFGLCHPCDNQLTGRPEGG